MTQYPTYTHVTDDIKVSVYPIFLENQSNPDEYHFLWAYHVKIENLGKTMVQLRSRYWRIIDGFGRFQEVKGPGVVGEQPVLNPGESFEYTSGTPLSTPSGIMEGHYVMETVKGEKLEVRIPSFSLDSPFDRVSWH
ncbi:MAG: Co2+/Mg2+ efflux protein ApaG [Alphaproteobacteria bacterium]|nr:Co2+/Mg2+ efflux protein ApaG [Alphaproteobacteria bacterium]